MKGQPMLKGKKTYEDGVRHAAELANHYNSCTTHPYRLGDCILHKMNMLDKKKVRRNIKLKQSKGE
jgi:hypothetical protein